MAEKNGGDEVVDALVGAGVEVIFGIPSVHNLPIYDAIRRDGRLRAVTVRHEQAGAGAADGYARATGRLGVVLTSTGPGAANAMGGQLEAYVSGSPILHLTGQIESRYRAKAKGFIHEVPDQRAMLASLSKAVHEPSSPGEIATSVTRAAAEAMAFPRGPVSVEIPIDFQYANVPARTSSPSPAEGPAGLAAQAQIQEAAELIASSRRPIVWAGGGAVAAEAGLEVASLVHRLGAGLLTSPNGRGIVSEDDPSCIGNLSWDEGVRELCGDADLLVAIGTRFQGPNTQNWSMKLPRNLVHIDSDPGVPGRNYPVALALIGDARATTAALLAALDSLGAAARLAEAGWQQRVGSVARSARERLRATLGAQLGLLDTLALLLEPGTVVVKDSTIPAYTWGNRLLPVRRARTSIMANSFAIGLGVAHALGAAVGSPGRPVVLLAGDGGFLVCASELATISEEHLAVIAIVFVDGGYGVVRNIQERQYGQGIGRIGVDLATPDYCALARAFGIESARVTTISGYAAVLGEVLGAPQPFLLEVDLESIGPMSVTYTGTSRPPQSL